MATCRIGCMIMIVLIVVGNDHIAGSDSTARVIK